MGWLKNQQNKLYQDANGKFNEMLFNEMTRPNMKTKHPGFKAVAKKIEGQGYSKKAAGAILAAKTRAASSAAKKKNPRLKRVK